MLTALAVLVLLVTLLYPLSLRDRPANARLGARHVSTGPPRREVRGRRWAHGVRG
jgi:hypothetical protein